MSTKMSTTMACAACRRSKMKCVGFDNPPCVRCAKVGRECLRQQYTRNRPGMRTVEKTEASSNKPTPYSMSEILTPQQQPPRAWHSNESNFTGEESRDWLPNNSNLPSIYSTPPLMSVVEQSTPSDSTFTVSSKRRRKEPPSSEDPLFNRDMVQLIKFATQKLLIYIPILPPEDIEDPQKVIDQKKCLANCICFVAARFLPGGNTTREKLLPAISNLLHQRFPVSRGGDEDELATLQAFAVLYVYRSATSSTSVEDLAHWRLKAIVEAYAVHIGCHRSVNELRSLIRSRAPNITSSKSYKSYTIWLWLFTMSQHVSLVTGSPPSIVEDATIRLAPEILGVLHNRDSITRMLGEVELCLLWSQASLRESGLGEWWCQVETTGSETSVAVLNDVDALLETWSNKWEPFMAKDSGAIILDFHLQFAKFCMSTYFTRNFKISSRQLPENHQALVRRSTNGAARFIKLLTDMDPVSKDERVRYISDFGFVMISFCCQFILRACESFGSGLPDILDHLDTVEDAAQLMKEVAIDSTHSPALYGSLISKGLEKARATMVPAEDLYSSHHTVLNTPNVWEDGLMMMDPLWEFSSYLQGPSFDQGI